MSVFFIVVELLILLAILLLLWKFIFSRIPEIDFILKKFDRKYQIDLAYRQLESIRENDLNVREIQKLINKLPPSEQREARLKYLYTNIPKE